MTAAVVCAKRNPAIGSSLDAEHLARTGEVIEANACEHDCSCDCAECHIRGRRRVSAEDRRRIAR